MSQAIIVTGGAGFIGSAVVREALRQFDCPVVNVDKLTYAANPDAVASAAGNPRYRFCKADIADSSTVRSIIGETAPVAIINLAAETHVDRSIDSPADFIQTNVVGTFVLLDAALDYWRSLAAPARSTFRFIQVSTDEVFGSLGTEGAFDSDSPHRPNSPYAASKAAGDHLVRAWFHTYGFPGIVTNSSNNYGPFQFPEKLIPVIVYKALAGEPIPLYGKGENRRDWIHVDDHAEGILAAWRRGVPGETYLFGNGTAISNLELAKQICRLIDELAPRAGFRHESLITFVADRPWHDFRYAVDPSRSRGALGWSPRRDFAERLRETVVWYLNNETWRSSAHKSGRLGLARAASR